MLTIEELAAKAGLNIGTYLVTAGRLYRVERFTRLRIYLQSFQDRRHVRGPVMIALPWDSYGLHVVGNHDTYVEVPEYALKIDESAATWVNNLKARALVLTETDEAAVIARFERASVAAAPITEEIGAEMQRHRDILGAAQEKRRLAITDALTK